MSFLRKKKEGMPGADPAAAASLSSEGVRMDTFDPDVNRGVFRKRDANELLAELTSEEPATVVRKNSRRAQRHEDKMKKRSTRLASEDLKSKSFSGAVTVAPADIAAKSEPESPPPAAKREPKAQGSFSSEFDRLLDEYEVEVHNSDPLAKGGEGELKPSAAPVDVSAAIITERRAQRWERQCSAGKVDRCMDELLGTDVEEVSMEELSESTYDDLLSLRNAFGVLSSEEQVVYDEREAAKEEQGGAALAIAVEDLDAALDQASLLSPHTEEGVREVANEGHDVDDISDSQALKDAILADIGDGKGTRSEKMKAAHGSAADVFKNRPTDLKQSLLRQLSVGADQLPARPDMERMDSMAEAEALAVLARAGDDEEEQEKEGEAAEKAEQQEVGEAARGLEGEVDDDDVAAMLEGEGGFEQKAEAERASEAEAEAEAENLGGELDDILAALDESEARNKPSSEVQEDQVVIRSLAQTAESLPKTATAAKKEKKQKKKTEQGEGEAGKTKKKKSKKKKEGVEETSEEKRERRERRKERKKKKEEGGEAADGEKKSKSKKHKKGSRKKDAAGGAAGALGAAAGVAALASGTEDKKEAEKKEETEKEEERIEQRALKENEVPLAAAVAPRGVHLEAIAVEQKKETKEEEEEAADFIAPTAGPTRASAAAAKKANRKSVYTMGPVGPQGVSLDAFDFPDDFDDGLPSQTKSKEKAHGARMEKDGKWYFHPLDSLPPPREFQGGPRKYARPDLKTVFRYDVNDHINEFNEMSD